MKKFAFLLLFVALFVGFSCKNQKQSQKQTQEVKILELKNLDKQADSLINKEVQVSGFVSHVCHEDGKKLMLWDSVADVRLKVITENPFDTTLEGQVVTLIGVLKAKPFNMNDYRDLEKKMKTHHPNGLDKDDSLRLVYLLEKLQAAEDSTINFYYIEFEKFVK